MCARVICLLLFIVVRRVAYVSLANAMTDMLKEAMGLCTLYMLMETQVSLTTLVLLCACFSGRTNVAVYCNILFDDGLPTIMPLAMNCLFT